MKDTLSTRDGIALGFASVIGSGLFFLPVVAASHSPGSPVLPWLLVALFCVPFIRVFSSFVDGPNLESGVIELVYRYVGSFAGDYLSFLTILVTSFGMPLAAAVAGSYLSALFHLENRHSAICFAGALLFVAWLQGLIGLRIAKAVQSSITVLAMLGLMAFFLSQSSSIRLSSAHYTAATWKQALLTAPIIFWAYSGWENLTFLAGRFKAPNRQIPLILSLTLLFSFLVYSGFSVLASGTIGLDRGRAIEGFSAIPQGTSSLPFKLLCITAGLLIWANLSAWVLGLNELAKSLLQRTMGKDFARCSIFFLGAGYFIGFAVEAFSSVQHEFIVASVSGGFATVYVVVLLAYLRKTKRNLDRILGFPMLGLGCCYLATFGSALALSLLGLILSIPFSTNYLNHTKHKIGPLR